MGVAEVLIKSIVDLLGGEVIGYFKNKSEIVVDKIPECENDGNYNYYFINRESLSSKLNSMGKSIDFTLINNSNNRVIMYIIDIKTKVIYGIANNEGNKYITIDPKSSVKIKVENIDEYEQSVIYISRDQKIHWEYLPLSDISI